MTISIRRAGATDYQAICDLIPSAEELFLVYPKGNFPLTVEQVDELFRKRTDPTVMLEHARVVGFADYYNFRQGKSAYVGNVVVDPAERGRGFGKRIIVHLIDRAFETYRLPQLRISVYADNTPALLLYGSLGFQPYRLRDARNHRGERVALIHLRLKRERYQRPAELPITAAG